MNRTQPTTDRFKATRTGFSLIEILIVVAVLGILAALAVPQFTSAASQSRENSLKMDLHRIRTQLEIYKQQHNGNWPSFDDFEAQLTQATDEAGTFGAVGTAGLNLGPYLRQIPVNPQTSSNTLGTGAAGTSDWYYDENIGEFLANDSDLSRTY